MKDDHRHSIARPSTTGSEDPDRRHSVAYAASIAAGPRYWMPEKAFMISPGAATAAKCYEENLADDERTRRLLHAAYLTLCSY